MIEALETLRGVLGDLHSAEHLTLLLIGLIAGGFFLAWNSSPQRALTAWLVTFSIQFSAGTFHLSLSDIFLGPLAVGAFIYWLTRKDKSVTIPAPVLIFTFIFLTAGNIVTALTLGKLPQWTWLNKDLGLLALLIPYWAMLVLCRDREDTAKLIHTFVSSVSVVNAIGVTLYVCSLFTGFGDIVNYGGMRFKGFMLDPNGYAGLAASTAILQFTILNLHTKRGARSLLGVVNCVMLVAGCLLTLSRGGLISLVAGGLVFLYFSKARSGYTIIFALAALALSVVWLSSHSELSDSIERRANDRSNIDSRIDYMQQGMRMYLSSPRTLLTGIGIGTFVEESPKYFGDNHQIHNTYVWLLVEGGPVLFIAYLLVLYRALRNNLWIYKNVPALRYAGAGCFCALVTTMIWSMTVEGMYHHHFWILLALSELMWVHSRREIAVQKMPRRTPQIPSGVYAPALT